MPEGTYTMLKPLDGQVNYPELNRGANYMVAGVDRSVSTYKRASAIIILPKSNRLVGNGLGRNAYISLGIGASEGAIDIGLRNCGLDGGGDIGFGWHPYCVDCSADKGYYYDGIDRTPAQAKYPAAYAPSLTKRAKVEIEPNSDGRSIKFSVTWLDNNNSAVASAFNTVIRLTKKYTWANFYRFASLVPWPSTPANNDGTYITGGEFLDVKVGNANWGISTPQVSRAWIIHHPKCQLPDGYWDTGEQFRIDHWA